MVKLGRNDPCHCGSGKKYKKCCSDKDLQQSLSVAKADPVEEWEPEHPVHEPNEDFHEKFFDEDSVTKKKSLLLVDKPYPEISKQDNKLVDAWWVAYRKLKSPEDIKNHLEAFMDDHPQLVENLEIDHDVLFELGGDYKQEGRPDEYILFLIKIRDQFPSTYLRSAGYYDLDIIAWLISKRRINEIEHYLNYFVEYPLDFDEQTWDVISLFLATDTTGQLLPFLLKISERLASSKEISGGDEIVMPLIIHTLSKYLKPEFTENDIEHFMEDVQKVLPYKITDIHAAKDFWKERCHNILRPYEPWPDTILTKKSQVRTRYNAVTSNFIRYMHESAGISWMSAQYHAALIDEYLESYLDNLKGKKPRNVYNFSLHTIDTIALRLTQRMFLFIDCTKFLSLLNAIHYFAAYLHTCGVIDEEHKNIIQMDCKSLYSELYPDLKTKHVEAYCFPEFPSWDRGSK